MTTIPQPTLHLRCTLTHVLLWLLVLSGALPAQALGWTFARTPAPFPYYGNRAITYDSARERMVLIGGGPGLFERIGGRWSYRDCGTMALATSSVQAIVYDEARRRTIHLTQAGYSPTLMFLYEWDGESVVLRQPAVSPPPRTSFSLAYDAARQQVVLFGGEGPYQDTWLWNGTQWTQASPAQRPPARSRATAAYHAPSQRVVLFGGDTGGGLLGDTWEWDGTNWTQRSPASSPAPRCAAALAYHTGTQRLVLYGGGGQSSSAQNLNDTWDWDGNTWSQLSPASSPPGLWGASMAHDPIRQRMVLHGGSNSTWEFDGVTWTLVAENSPTEGAGPMAFDQIRGNFLLFGGFTYNGHEDASWLFDGATWTLSPAPVRPPARTNHRLAWDPATLQLLLFGGESALGMLNDTWHWDGTQWLQQSPSNAPSPRSEFAMACDNQRQRVVLFGGWNGTTRFADTWEWDGTNWAQHVAAGPTPRFGHAMAYDNLRQRTILFGGCTAFGSLAGISAQTWEWNGAAWSQRFPAHVPGIRYGQAMAWDPRQGKVLMGGGTANNGFSDYWQWDGADWAQMPTSPSDIWPFTSINRVIAMDFDPWMSRMVLHSAYGRTYFLETLVAPPAGFGAGCAGAHPAPRLAVGSPFPGSPSCHVDLLGDVPGTLAVIGLALQSGSLPIGGGCTYLLGANAVLNAGVTNAAGFHSLVFAVPRNPALVGLAIHAQAFVFDPPGGAFGFAASAGVTMQVGNW